EVQHVFDGGCIVVEDVGQMIQEEPWFSCVMMDGPLRWFPKVEHTAPVSIMGDLRLTWHELDALGHHKHSVVVVVVFVLETKRQHVVWFRIPKFLPPSAVGVAKAILCFCDPPIDIVAKGCLLKRVGAKDKSVLLCRPSVLPANLFHGLAAPRVELGCAFDNQGAPWGRRGLPSI